MFRFCLFRFTICAHLILLLHLLQSKTFEDNWLRFLTGHMALLLLPNQQHQSTEGDKKKVIQVHLDQIT